MMAEESIKRLRMMGYNVVESYEQGQLVVSLRTGKRFSCHIKLGYEVFSEPYAVEHIVYALNGHIVNEL